MELLILIILCLAISGLITYLFYKTDKFRIVSTAKEIAVITIIPVIFSVILVAFAWNNKVSDTEVINGYVTSKSSDRVSCSHSYPCHCRTDSKGNMSCDTCYEHSYDIDWNLHTNLNKDITIDRIDSRGVKEPRRYAIANVGDPAAFTHTFVNYIKGAEHSLFNESENSTKYADRVPPYPSAVYDYHYVNRVLVDKVAGFKDLNKWNDTLARSLNQLGVQKQVNVILLFTSVDSQDYIHSVRKKWLGGKKNDVIVIVGTPNYPDIEWVRVVSWTDSELFKVELQDDLYDLKTIGTPEQFIEIISKQISSKFERKHMRDFEYLKEDITPDVGWIVAAILGCIIFSIVINVVLRKR